MLNLCTSHCIGASFVSQIVISYLYTWYFPRLLNCSILWAFWVQSLIAKLILQDLWQLVIQWDKSVPQNIHTLDRFQNTDE